jgi:hypothetical protein
MPHHKYQSCIEACHACAVACNHCAASCLREPDVKAMAGCIALDMDCAAICETAAGLMARGSDYAEEFCVLCAQICEACAEECVQHDMDHCQACARACKLCAEACHEMAAMA